MICAGKIADGIIGANNGADFGVKSESIVFEGQANGIGEIGDESSRQYLQDGIICDQLAGIGVEPVNLDCGRIDEFRFEVQTIGAAFEDVLEEIVGGRFLDFCRHEVCGGRLEGTGTIEVKIGLSFGPIIGVIFKPAFRERDRGIRQGIPEDVERMSIGINGNCTASDQRVLIRQSENRRPIWCWQNAR